MSVSSKDREYLEALKTYALRDEDHIIIGARPGSPEWAREIILEEIDRRNRGELT